MGELIRKVRAMNNTLMLWAVCGLFIVGPACGPPEPPASTRAVRTYVQLSGFEEALDRMPEQLEDTIQQETSSDAES